MNTVSKFFGVCFLGIFLVSCGSSAPQGSGSPEPTKDQHLKNLWANTSKLFLLEFNIALEDSDLTPEWKQSISDACSREDLNKMAAIHECRLGGQDQNCPTFNGQAICLEAIKKIPKPIRLKVLEKKLGVYAQHFEIIHGAYKEMCLVTPELKDGILEACSNQDMSGMESFMKCVVEFNGDSAPCGSLMDKLGAACGEKAQELICDKQPDRQDDDEQASFGQPGAGPNRAGGTGDQSRAQGANAEGSNNAGPDGQPDDGEPTLP